jgi:hypothetical protein
MVNIQEYTNRRNPVTVYSPTRVIDRQRAQVGRSVLASRGAPSYGGGGGGRAGTQAGPLNLQLGSATAQQAMPDTSMGGAGMSSLDAILAHSREVTSGAAPAQDQGGWRGTLGHLVNSPVGRAAMGALTVLDYPRRIVTSGIQEAADVFNGGDASWDDFAHQITEGIGFGDIIGSTGNIWLDRGLGFLGDVALDPLTYVGGAGLLAGTGREARAGLAARVLEMGLGEETAKKVGRYGIHALSDSERQMISKAGTEAGGIFAEGAEKIKDAGYYAHFPFSERQFRIPGTGTIDRVVGGAASRTRAGLAASPLGGWLRHRNVDEAVVQSINRLVAGEGTISLAAAAETYNWYQAFKLGGGMAKREAEAALNVLLKTNGGPDGLSAMIRQAEEEGGTALNSFFERMSKVLDDVGIAHGTITKDASGNGIHYIPHYYSERGVEWLGKTQSAEATAMAKVFGAGNSLEDYSPSLMKRHFTPRDNPYVINGKEFHIHKGTIEEINSEFRRVTGNDFDLLETDAAKILSRYSESIGSDVGRMTGVQRLLKSKTGLLRNANDASVLKAMVDDVATGLATDKMKVQLHDQLNRIGEATQQLSEELAKGLHNTGSELLKARFSTIIDNLTSATQRERDRLAQALEIDSGLSRMLGRTSTRGEKNPTSALLEAFNAHMDSMLGRLKDLGAERAQLQRAAELERNMLVSSLATAKAGGAAMEELPRRLANLQRYQEVTAKMLETQRDVAAVRALQDQMNWAAHQAEHASRLADDGSFLSQFIPGEADRIATAQKIENQTRARNETIELVSKPLDPVEIAKDASQKRHHLVATIGSTTPDRPLTPRMATLQNEFRAAANRVDSQHARMLAAASALHDARVANNPRVAAAISHAEGVAQAYAAKKMTFDSLEGDPARVYERMQLNDELIELQRGQIAETKRSIEQARKPIRDAETALEAERIALVKENAKFIEAARKIDEEAAIPLASAEGLPQPKYTPEQMAEIRSQLDDLERQHRAWENSAEGKATLSRRETLAQVTAQHEEVDSHIKLMTSNPESSESAISPMFTIDNKGDVVLRRENDAETYQMALARDDYAKEFEVRSAELQAAREDADAYRLRQGATAGQQARKDAKVRSLEKKVEAAADGRDDLNTKLMGRTHRGKVVQRGEVHKRYVPTDTPALRRIQENLEAAVIERAKLAKRMRGLEGALGRTRVEAVADRERIIAELRGKVDDQAQSLQARAQAEARITAVEADRARRAARRAAHDEMLGIAPRVDVPIARPMESRAFAIQAEADRKLSQRERIIGRAVDNARETAMGEQPNVVAMHALSGDDRFAWEHAQAVIRERDSFPGGESNSLVQRARRTIKEIKPRIGEGVREDVYTTGTRDVFTPMNEALEGIEASRTAWKPRTKMGKRIKELEEANLAGLRSQGGATDVATRGRLARDWSHYVTVEVQPELIAKGALPAGAPVMGTPDIPEFMSNAFSHLRDELDAYSKSPSALGEERLENALATANRWSEFALRYQAAIKAGANVDNQTAAFVWARTLGNESENLGAQISNLEARLQPSLSGPQIEKIQARWGEKLPEHLRVEDLTIPERNEIRFLNERYKLEVAIENDRKIMQDINAKEASGVPLEPGEKGSRTLARNRLERNTHKLDLHNAKEGEISPGPMQNVVNHVAGILNDAITKYSAALSGTRDVEDAAKTAARMGETAAELKVHIAQREGQVEAFKVGNERLATAIANAERRGSEFVQYRAFVEEEFFISVDEAQRMLDNGEIPAYVRPQVERAIGRSRRRSQARATRSFNMRDRASLEARAQAVREGRQAGTIPKREALAELAAIRERLDVIKEYEARFTGRKPEPTQNPAAFVDRGNEPGEVANRVVEPEAIRGRRRKVGDAKSRRAAAARESRAQRREAFATEKGLHPDDVISTKHFVDQTGPGSMPRVPIDEARKQLAKDQASVANLEAFLEESRLQASIYDGSINDEIAIQKAILADQAGEELPDVAQMQSMLDEINARAANRRSVFDSGGRVGSFEELGQVLGKDVDHSTFMTPEEAAQANEIGQRIAAIQRYGKMTPEQLKGVQDRLDDISEKIRVYERKMGSRFDQIDAIHDNGERYFNSLLDGTRQPTIKDAALMRDILGAAETDVAQAFITQLNELLGVSRRNSRADINLVIKQLGHPPIKGPARELLFETTDPSRLDLEELRRAVNSIPMVDINETNIEQIQGWQRALEHLTTDPVELPPGAMGRETMRAALGDKSINLSGEKLSEVFTALGASFGDSPLLGSMRQAVIDAAEDGVAITNGTLRDVVARTLVASAKQHEQGVASNLHELMNSLGLRFQPGVTALSSKLSAMGYVMGGTEVSQVKLREFITRQLESAGIPLQGRLEDQLTQLKLRKMHVDSMRIGLGADLKNVSWETDPRVLFEATSKPHLDKARKLDNEITAFNGAVTPQHVDRIYNERIDNLKAELVKARDAGDAKRESEIYDLLADLDGRRMADPETPPSAVQPAPETNPQASFETQMAKAESALTDASAAVNKARTDLTTVEKRIADGVPPQFSRHPDTPEDMYSLGEFMAKNAEVLRATQTGNREEIDRLGREFEQMTPKLWQAEPEESKAAVRAAGQGASDNDAALEAARSQLNQAETAQAEAQRKVDQLRQRGPVETADVETPENSLGQIDEAAEATDPDEAMTFEQTHAEYEAMIKQVNDMDQITKPTDEQIQQRAAAAARARKMADLRGRKWPQHRVELERQRAEAYAHATNTDLLRGDVGSLAPGTVTWNVWHTMTTGAPNSRFFTPPIGTKALRGKVGMVGSLLEDFPTQPAGRYTRNSLPQLERSLTERLAPALAAREELRGIMLEARNTAEELRGRIQQHLDAYDGIDMDGEVERLVAERAELEARLARPLGEEVYLEQMAATNQRIAEAGQEVAQEMADITAARSEQRRVMRQVEQDYTEMVRTADKTLADVRDGITDAGARIDAGEVELKKYKVLDYQGVSTSDMEWHTDQLRELNKSLPAATPEAAADIEMVATLLDRAMLQAQEIRKLEGDRMELAKRLKDFESGADTTAQVIRHQLVDGWTPMFKELIDPDGPDAVVMANELSRAIGNLDAALRKPETWGLVDQFTRLFKTYATATPGFHVRNLISGIFMNYVDNVRTGHMLRAGRIWNDFIRDPMGYMSRLPPESDERRALMVVFGTGASGTWVDTGALPKGFGERGSRLMNNFVTKWNQRMGSRVEGTLRLGMALDSMAKGQNIAAAMERVTRYHFDYSRMSTVDHNMRRLVPFWTFLSRNIPLQIESMWLRPATYLHYQSFVRNFGEAADPLTPEYWLSQGAFTMDEHAAQRENPWYLAPDLPFLRVTEPLEALAQGDLGRALLSNFNPALAAPVEAFAAGRKFYSGAPIEQEYNEPSAAMKPLMTLFALLGGTKEGASGQRLLDDRYAHVARSTLPPLNLLERLTDTTGTREGRTDETWLRTIGAPVYQLTDNLRDITRRSNYYDRRDAARARADLARK